MQADAQPRQLPRARDRILRGGTRDHEACGSENAVLMRRLDGLVDLGSEPEIVGGDDELFHVNRTVSPPERDEFRLARPLNQAPFVSRSRMFPTSATQIHGRTRVNPSSTAKAGTQGLRTRPKNWVPASAGTNGIERL